jgi:hypothetical protein
VRLRAVLFALYYGLAPYPLYEAFCHYGRSKEESGDELRSAPAPQPEVRLEMGAQAAVVG